MQFAISDITRSLTTDINTEDSKFCLYGEKMFDGEKEFHGPLVIFDSHPVQYDFERNVWRYGEPQYWFPGHEYSFVAMHPMPESIKGLSAGYENPELRLTYSIPVSEDNKVKKEDIADIIVATHRRLYHAGETGRTSLGFKHIMSVLDITPALVDTLMFPGDDESRLDQEFLFPIIKNEYIQFMNVELYGFRTKADFSISPDPLNTASRTDDNTVTIDVDNSLPYADMTITFTEENAGRIINSDINNVINYSIFGENEAIAMLPHTMSADAKIVMTYTVNADSLKDDSVRTITVPIPEMKLESGKYYRLCFTIEKVYSGQIRDGSLKWIVTDLTDESAKDNWISNHDTIRQEFDTPKTANDEPE